MSACRWRHEAEIQMIVLIAEGLCQRFDPLFLRTLGEGALDTELLLEEISDPRQVVETQRIGLRHTLHRLNRGTKLTQTHPRSHDHQLIALGFGSGAVAGLQ